MEAVTVQPPSGKPAAGEGIYVYCIIESAEPRSFGKIGIGGRGDEVFTVHHQDLAAVVSRSPLMVYDPTRENALTHEHVNEVVMIDNNFTPVPMSFGTLFKTEDDTKEFLKDTYKELRDVLSKMKDKLEFGLKVNWDRESVLTEVERDYEEIRRLKAQIESTAARITAVLSGPKPAPGPRARSANLGDVSDAMASLYKMTDVDAAPTAALLAEAARAERQLGELARAWAAIESGELARLNAALAKAGLTPIKPELAPETQPKTGDEE